MKKPAAHPARGTPPARAPREPGISVITDWHKVYIPASVVDLESFREWTNRTDFPERENIWWLCGQVWADLSREEIFSHVLLRGELYRVVLNITKPDHLGRVLAYGLLLTNRDGDFSGSPDGVYVSNAAFASGQVRLIPDGHGDYSEMQGTPDAVIEVVSDSSVNKDTVVLMDAYWKAGIPEYWLIDARRGQLRYDIFRRGPKAYKRTPKKHGWVGSAVFGKSFRLSVSADEASRPDYTLDVR
jgi:Uma2 family endonuclease